LIDTFPAPHKFEYFPFYVSVSTAISDFHEITYILEITGIVFMFRDVQHTPNDIFFMFQSCVSISMIADDVDGTVIIATTLAKYTGIYYIILFY
jgi:adenine deaminase